MMKKFKIGNMSFALSKKNDLMTIRIGKTEGKLKAIDFWGIAFEIAKDNEMKDKLMPVRKEEIMKFKKVHTVQLKNDMKAGETLTFTCNIDVPTRIIDGMRDIVSKEVEGAREILKEVIPSVH